MTLPKMIEFAVWSHLDEIESFELILLKGHLLLECVVDNTLGTLIERGDIESLNLGFYKKLELLALLHRGRPEDFLRIRGHIVRLNKLRNQLAHQLMFENGKEELGLWASQVLTELPKAKFTKFTYRTKVVHAFASVASELSALAGSPLTP